MVQHGDERQARRGWKPDDLFLSPLQQEKHLQLNQIKARKREREREGGEKNPTKSQHFFFQKKEEEEEEEEEEAKWKELTLIFIFKWWETGGIFITTLVIEGRFQRQK